MGECFQFTHAVGNSLPGLLLLNGLFTLKASFLTLLQGGSDGFSVSLEVLTPFGINVRFYLPWEIARRTSILKLFKTVLACHPHV